MQSHRDEYLKKINCIKKNRKLGRVERAMTLEDEEEELQNRLMTNQDQKKREHLEHLRQVQKSNPQFLQIHRSTFQKSSSNMTRNSF